ncbi:MAG: cyclophilin-like fold protein [Chloroflexota bacterium]
MAKKIRIKVGAVEAAAELNETKTAQAIWEALPIESDFDLWGDEIYFSIPVSLKLENGQKSVKIGDLGYWPPGNAFCIFFGQTPASTQGEIRPASAVNVFGKITGDAAVFKKVKSGAKITVEGASKNAD